MPRESPYVYKNHHIASDYIVYKNKTKLLHT